MVYELAMIPMNQRLNSFMKRLRIQPFTRVPV